jgi:hypothetical protein
MRKTILVIWLMLITLVINANAQDSDEESTKRMMDKFIGLPKKQIFMAWGSPVSATSDGEGGEILLFQDKKKGILPYPNINYCIHNYTWFFNEEGIAYYWKYGKNCGSE